MKKDPGTAGIGGEEGKPEAEELAVRMAVGVMRETWVEKETKKALLGRRAVEEAEQKGPEAEGEWKMSRVVKRP